MASVEIGYRPRPVRQDAVPQVGVIHVLTLAACAAANYLARNWLATAIERSASA